MAGEHYDLSGFAIPEELASLHDLLERAGREHPEFDATDLMLLETAVIEIANNVVEHGRPAGHVRWRFELAVTPETLRATLFDDGQAFAGDVTTAMPDALDESGRGLALASTVLDELSYSRDDGHNEWRMVRRRTASGAE
jgi:serine/threonine-protein kinase RsbW